MLSLFWSSFLLTAISGLGVVYALLQTESDTGPMERLEQLTGRHVREAEKEATGDVIASPGKVSGWRARFAQLDTDNLRKQFVQAGWREEKAQQRYTSARVLLPLLGVLAAFALPGPKLVWAMMVPAVLYMALTFFLKSRVKRRRKAMQRAVPDMLDLLVICVEAGLSIDQALLRVAMEMELAHPELHEELMQIVHEQRAGKPRQDAWKEAVARLEVPELEAYMNMMLQSERFGTPIAQALRTYAGGVQQKRVQAAEEKAAKTTIKIIFPLAFFSLPSIFIVILGPAALNLIRSF